MEEKERGWYVFWIFVLGALLVGTTAAAFNLWTENAKLKEKVESLELQFSSLQSQYDDLQKKYNAAVEEIKAAWNRYTECDLERMDLEEDVRILKGTFVNYDKLVSAMMWYYEVNTCDEYVANYLTFRDMVTQAKEFFLAHMGDIERLLDDKTAQEFGLKEGLDVLSLVTAMNTFIGNLDQTYSYCVGG